MGLKRETKKSNDVRAPAVPRGRAVIVTRYRDDKPKVALVNPDDLAMLEEAHELLESAGRLEPAPVSDLALKALRLEDRPDEDARVEDADRIAAILGL